jgi:hypothetical protein
MHFECGAVLTVKHIMTERKAYKEKEKIQDSQETLRNNWS